MGLNFASAAGPTAQTQRSLHYSRCSPSATAHPASRADNRQEFILKFVIKLALNNFCQSNLQNHSKEAVWKLSQSLWGFMHSLQGLSSPKFRHHIWLTVLRQSSSTHTARSHNDCNVLTGKFTIDTLCFLKQQSCNQQLISLDKWWVITAKPLLTTFFVCICKCYMFPLLAQ